MYIATCNNASEEKEGNGKLQEATLSMLCTQFIHHPFSASTKKPREIYDEKGS